MSATTSDIFPEILHLRHLLPDVVFLREADHKDDGDFHEEVDHGEENDEVVEALLPVLHLIGVPVGDPVDHPEKVNKPSHYQQDQQFHFLILNRGILSKIVQ